MHLQDICFRAADSGAESTTLCITVSVKSCRWHASAGQSLDSIATLFGSNYVQVGVPHTRVFDLKVGLCISQTKTDSQWNPVYEAFHRIHRCGNETKQFFGSNVNKILTRQICGQRSSRAAESKRRAWARGGEGLRSCRAPLEVRDF